MVPPNFAWVNLFLTVADYVDGSLQDEDQSRVIEAYHTLLKDKGAAAIYHAACEMGPYFLPMYRRAKTDIERAQLVEDNK